MDHNKTLYTSNSKGIGQFLARLFKFAIVCCCVLGCIFCMNKLLIRASPLILDENVDTIFLGDSRIRGGLSDVVIPNSVNLAQSAEPLSVSFFKLRHILYNNRELLDNIVVGVSYSSFSKYKDFFFQHERWDREMLGRVYPITNSKDYSHLLINRQVAIEMFAKNMLYPNFGYIKNLFSECNEKEFPFLVDENFQSLEIGKIPILKRRLKNLENLPEFKHSLKKLKNKTEVHFNFQGNQGVIENPGFWIREIEKLCYNYGVNIFFVSMPLHEDYRNKASEEIVNGFYEIFQDTKQKNGVFFVDYSQFIEDDRLFRDYDHVNSYGKIYMSEIFYKNQLLDSQQNFSDSDYQRNKLSDLKCKISKINGKNVDKFKKTVKIKGDKLIIHGWAFDNLKREPLLEVDLVIGERIFKANYGKTKGAIQEIYGDKLLNTGFHRMIPVSEIDAGVYEIGLNVTYKNGDVLKINNYNDLKIIVE